MTDHPLTHGVVDKIAHSSHWSDDVGDVVFMYYDMRAAADWQLEEVKRKVELTLTKWRREGYGAGADACEDFFEEIMQELRPQQLEDN